MILKSEKKEELPIRLTKKIDGLITSPFALCNRFSAYSSCDCGACSRSSYSSDGCDDGGDDGCSGDGCDDGGGCNSGGKSEQTHYLQQVDLLQRALLLLP